MPNRSKGSAILHGKCPRCRSGSMFVTSAYNLSGFQKMNKNCPSCGLRFEREPGFFFGAMYISYAFSVALFVAVGLGLSIVGDFPLYIYFISIVLAVIIFLPVSFRYSRILFLHLFGGIDFDPKNGN
ncbi:MAG: DUF983 domain-containing protein [Bacteroidota bacterium]